MAAVAEDLHTDTITIPGEDDFFEEEEYRASPELTDLGRRLIESCEELAHLGRTPINYVWRKEGGETAGKAVLGKCTKLSGYARYLSEADFLIALSADHCRTFGLTTRQIEALMFHELLHATHDVKTGKPKIRPHDVEAFLPEIARYGLWTSELKETSDVMRQATLPIGLVPFGGKA